MNINRKRQLIRRKMKTAEAKVEALKADENIDNFSRLSAAVAISVAAKAECGCVATGLSDPMDVLDITHIGADYLVAIPSFKDPKTNVVDVISGWDVNLSDPRK